MLLVFLPGKVPARRYFYGQIIFKISVYFQNVDLFEDFHQRYSNMKKYTIILRQPSRFCSKFKY